MIWLVKQLSDDEKDKLRALEPFADVHRNAASSHWTTSCRGWEIRNGIYQEIRKVRVDSFDNICGGLISDDVEEAIALTADFSPSDTGPSSWNLRCPEAYEYCLAHKREHLCVAVPVRFVFAYFAECGKHHLDYFDPDELHRKWRIDVTDYLSRG